MFGTDEPDSHKDWVKSIAKVTTTYTLGSEETNTNFSHFLFRCTLTEGKFDLESSDKWNVCSSFYAEAGNNA